MGLEGRKEAERNKGRRTVLREVSAVATPGQFVAIMGASGSGKTTLLNALAGRTDEKMTEGTVEFNGMDPRAFRECGYVAYVQQQDNLLPCLTVRETLRFAARLRLPRDMRRSTKYALVETAISELGLRECADTVIGDEWRKGISGGERRRVSVAVQLLMNPSLILMDEPTTGLDATTSHALMRTLASLCSKGRTIVVSIHQPRPQTFHLFHSVVLLARGGEVVFSGSALNLAPHFESCGVDLDDGQGNVAERLLDLATVDDRDERTEEESRRRVRRLTEFWRRRTGLSCASPTSPSTPSTASPSTAVPTKRWSFVGWDTPLPPPPPTSLPTDDTEASLDDLIRTLRDDPFAIDRARASVLCPRPVSPPPRHLVANQPVTRHKSAPTVRCSRSASSLSSTSTTLVSGGDEVAVVAPVDNTGSPCATPKIKDAVFATESPFPVWPVAPPPRPSARVSAFEEFCVLAKRSAVNIVRDRFLMWGTVVEALLVGTIVGAMFWKLDGTRAGIVGREAVLGTICSAMNYLLMTFGCYKLTFDLKIFDRERKDNMYRVETYLLSSILVNSLVFVVNGVLRCTIIYFMAGLRMDDLGYHLGVFLAGVIGMQICTLLWSYLFASLTRDFGTASGYLNMACGFLCISSGYLIPQTVIPQYLKWVNTISYFSAGYRLLVSNELSHHDFHCPDLPVTLLPNGTNPPCNGAALLDAAGLAVDDLYAPFFVMACNVMVVTTVVSLLLRFWAPGRRTVGTARGGWWKRSKQQPKDAHFVKVVEDACVRGVEIRVNELSIAVMGERVGGRGAGAMILERVETRFGAGQLNVIMGASGSGKTTLLTAVMARPLNFGPHTRTLQQGAVVYGDMVDAPTPDQVSALCSFVCQEDAHHLPTLTCRETLRYAALLRLPTHWDTKRKLLRAEEVLIELGLKGCADVRVGDDGVKGLSGGEKRRLSIGVQIITDPGVLVLDEPTSGLDSFSSRCVMMTLRKIASRGKTVICTIHQPRSDLFPMFDNILLLARGGRVVYSGPTTQILPHFENLGHPIGHGTNPADFILDLSSIDLRSPRLEHHSRRRVDFLTAAWRDRPRSRPSSDMSMSSKDTLNSARSSATAVSGVAPTTNAVTFDPVARVKPNQWSEDECVSETGTDVTSLQFSVTSVEPAYPMPRSIRPADKTAPPHRTTLGRSCLRLPDDRQPAYPPSSKANIAADAGPLRVTPRSTTPFTTAVRVLLSRMSTHVSRSPHMLFDRLGTVLGFAVVLSLYTYRLDDSEAKVQARIGVLQMFTSLIFMGMTMCVTSYPGDLRLLRADLADHAYSVQSFFVAGMLNELPYQLFTSTLFALALVGPIGLRLSTTTFLTHTLSALALLSTGESIGIAFCSVCRATPFTVQAMGGLITLATLLSGFLAIAPPPFLAALNRASVVRYTSRATAMAEFGGAHVVCDAGTVGAAGCRWTSGDDVLAMLGFADGDLWGMMAIVGGLVVAYRVAAYLVLRTMMRRR
ncbi:hypothetical protein HK101_008814 [Irineochytrium annulatum]|nr:hypothetical protein HK101_008814 [Irineochytrium annulatum]